MELDDQGIVCMFLVCTARRKPRIAVEGEGMVLGACEHYREVAILCTTHFRALKLLGSALLGVGEYKAAVKALEEAIYMKNDYIDGH
ncbi:hypothetical protein AAHA92_00483 [Salvia divinorum]|uniref:Uncharacterized protein n=1 Tax=Salvia divinorum TaxID=28513 RepID=A0ABD1IKD0_SALDI